MQTSIATVTAAENDQLSLSQTININRVFDKATLSQPLKQLKTAAQVLFTLSTN
jgi:phage tail sheath protein FI